MYSFDEDSLHFIFRYLLSLILKESSPSFQVNVLLFINLVGTSGNHFD